MVGAGTVFSAFSGEAYCSVCENMLLLVWSVTLSGISLDTLACRSSVTFWDALSSVDLSAWATGSRRRV